MAGGAMTRVQRVPVGQALAEQFTPSKRGLAKCERFAPEPMPN